VALNLSQQYACGSSHLINPPPLLTSPSSSQDNEDDLLYGDLGEEGGRKESHVGQGGEEDLELNLYEVGDKAPHDEDEDRDRRDDRNRGLERDRYGQSGDARQNKVRRPLNRKSKEVERRAKGTRLSLRMCFGVCSFCRRASTPRGGSVWLCSLSSLPLIPAMYLLGSRDDKYPPPALWLALPLVTTRNPHPPTPWGPLCVTTRARSTPRAGVCGGTLEKERVRRS
jgi:hypothetical protein